MQSMPLRVAVPHLLRANIVAVGVVHVPNRAPVVVVAAHVHLHVAAVWSMRCRWACDARPRRSESSGASALRSLTYSPRYLMVSPSTARARPPWP
jgi:hypothetical protein